MIGKILGNYRITAFIGEGGMGNVWAGEHQAIGRKVAIKILHAQYSRNAQIRERFKKEAATMAKLQHPNIVALYDYIETQDELCLVMEHVEGVDLNDYVLKQSGPIPSPKLGEIFRQMLSAIGYAHSNKVVHRDIKPSNFMLTPDGVVKVLDFGIAKMLEDDNQLTKTGTRMGTTLYMSPEQVNGNPIDHRTDIYSLGVTLFVLATGKAPYEGTATEFHVYNQIVNQPLPPPKSVYPGVTDGVERMIRIATAKRPEDRFQKCEDFINPNFAEKIAQKMPVPQPAVGNQEPVVQQPYPKQESEAPQPITAAEKKDITTILQLRKMRRFTNFAIYIIGFLSLVLLVLGGVQLAKSFREYDVLESIMSHNLSYFIWDASENMVIPLVFGTVFFSLGVLTLFYTLCAIGVKRKKRWGQVFGVFFLFLLFLACLGTIFTGIVNLYGAGKPEFLFYSLWYFIVGVFLLVYSVFGFSALFSKSAKVYLKKEK